MFTCMSGDIELGNTQCRICLEEATPRRAIQQRCHCASYHDDCFAGWLRHHQNIICEVCLQPYEGVRRLDKELTLASLQTAAKVWLSIYATILILLWILEGLMESYTHCVYHSQTSSVSQGVPPKGHCRQIEAIEEFILVICGISSAAWIFKALVVCACPRDAGLIIVEHSSRLIIDDTTTISITNVRNRGFQHPPTPNQEQASGVISL